MRSTLSVFAGVALAATAAFRWGEAGHRIAGEMAAETLPADMPDFFRAAKARLAYLNPEPDRWRDGAERKLDPALDMAFAADHFINLDMIPAERRASVLHAPSRYAYVDSLRALRLAPTRVGFSPFAMIEMAQRLRTEFRRWRAETNPEVRTWIEQRIIDDAGVLGHFVADASNPAHASKQFNGWTGPNPNGYATDTRFHGRFETEYVQAHIAAADLRPAMTRRPRVLDDLRGAIIEHLSRSLGEIEHLYQLDKRMPFNAANTGAEHKRFTVERLADGALMLRDVWWTAWVTSK